MYIRRGLGSASTGSVASLIQSTASRFGVPSAIALAVAQRESGLNQAAVGSSGEIGVFQLMPGTAGEIGVNPSDLNQNIEGGIRYLRDMYNRFGSWSLALQAYNGGPGNVERGTVSSAAKGYATAVLAASGQGSGFQDTPGGAFWYSAAGSSGDGLSGPAIAGIAVVGALGLMVLLD